jgi:hypothetical protein
MFSFPIQILKFYGDVYNTPKDNTNISGEHDNLVFLSKDKMLMFNKSNIDIKNTFGPHEYGHPVYLSKIFSCKDDMLIRIDTQTMTPKCYDSPYYDSLTKLYLKGYNKEYIKHYILLLANITKCIEESSKTKHKYSDLYVDFNASKFVDNIDTNFNHPTIIMEQIKKQMYDMYYINFNFIPIYRSVQYHFNGKNYNADNFVLLDAEKIYEKKYGINENIKFTSDIVRKEYYYKRTMIVPVITFVSNMMLHIDMFTSSDNYDDEIIQLFYVIKQILLLNNELKYYYISIILLENFNILTKQYCKSIFENDKFNRTLTKNYKTCNYYDFDSEIDQMKEHFQGLTIYDFTKPDRSYIFISHVMRSWFDIKIQTNKLHPVTRYNEWIYGIDFYKNIKMNREEEAFLNNMKFGNTVNSSCIVA